MKSNNQTQSPNFQRKSNNKITAIFQSIQLRFPQLVALSLGTQQNLFFLVLLFYFIDIVIIFLLFVHAFYVSLDLGSRIQKLLFQTNFTNKYLKHLLLLRDKPVSRNLFLRLASPYKARRQSTSLVSFTPESTSYRISQLCILLLTFIKSSMKIRKTTT